MGRRVFFSFHYANDIWRVSQIRNSGMINGGAQPFLDKAEWEKIKRANGVQAWIDNQMKGTSVLILCIGEETYKRKWVKYEIEKAYREGRGIVGIHLNKMKNRSGLKSNKGTNPLDLFIDTNTQHRLSKIFQTYSWVDDDGYNNIQEWVEEACKIAGR